MKQKQCEQTESEREKEKFRSKMRRFFLSKGFLNAVKITVGIVLLGLTVGAIVWIIPWIPKFVGSEDFIHSEVFQEFKDQIDGFAPYSWLILLGVQILQVVIAVIPGEPVEVLAGVFSGTLGGLALCLAGTFIGTVIIYYLVRWLGRSFIEKLFEKDKVRNFKLLNNPRNLEVLLFILFFVPGTPKDLLTYMAPLTRVKPIHFFLISTFARIPSIITSTYAGSHLGQGDVKKAVIMYAVAAVLGISGLLFYNWFSKRKAMEKADSAEPEQPEEQED